MTPGTNFRFALVALCFFAVAACSDSSGSSPDAGPADETVEPCPDGTALKDPNNPSSCCRPIECINGWTADDCACKPVCAHDSQCDTGMRCDLEVGGKCVAAVPCINSGDGSVETEDGAKFCSGAMPNLKDGSTPDNSYCQPGVQCRCVPNTGAGNLMNDANGFCVRRLPKCWTCENDLECGSFDAFRREGKSEPGVCVPLDGAKICLEKFDDATCKCGVSTQLTSSTSGSHWVCQPIDDEARNVCKNEKKFSCCRGDYEPTDPGNEDLCGAEKPYCKISNGICREPCNVNYSTYRTTNCSPDEVCHVEMKFLQDERSPDFGAGRCGSPCARNSDCCDNPAVCGTLQCIRDIADKPASARCRPKGCMDNKECSGDSIFPDTNRVFCDKRLNQNKCICDANEDSGCFCRGLLFDDAQRPTNALWEGNMGYYNACRLRSKTGAPAYPGDDSSCDCADGYKCSLTGDVNQCVPKDCIDFGGATNACNTFTECCGFDGDSPMNEAANKYRYNCMKTSDMGDLPETKPLGMCYRPPKDVWCGACETPADCVDDNHPKDLPSDPKIMPPGDDFKADVITCKDNVCAPPCGSAVDCPFGFNCTEEKIYCARSGTEEALGAVNTDYAHCGDPNRCTDVREKCQWDKDNGLWVCECRCTTPLSRSECADPQEPFARCSDTSGACVRGKHCTQRTGYPGPIDPETGNPSSVRICELDPLPALEGPQEEE